MRQPSARRVACRIAAAAAVAAVVGAASGAAAEDRDLLDGWADEARDAVVGRLDDGAAWFDRFFGDPRAEIAGRPGVLLRVTPETFVSGVPGDGETSLRVRGAVDLPRFENRLRVVATSDAEATLTGRDIGVFDPARIERARDDGGLGMRYLLLDAPGRQFGVGVGVAGGLSPDLVASARYRHVERLAPGVALAVTPTAYWRTDDGEGVSAAADLDWELDADTFWRVTLFADWRADDDETELSAQAGWWRRLGDRAAVNLRGGIRGDTEPGDPVREVWASVRYRRRLGRPWLFVEVEPGVSFHEKADHAPEPTLALRLEVLFDRDR